MRTGIGMLLFLWLGITGLYGQPFLYQNPDATFEDRTEDLVSRMTLDEKISQMMDVAPAIPRFDIPAYNWWNEGLHGVARAGIATVFPQAIGLAAMWNDSLQFLIASAISDEFRAKYHESIKLNDRSRYRGLTVWSPNINIFRDPRWGRGQETYGEDPYLTSRYGVAFVKGLQGNDPKYLKTVATPKHYAVHSGPEKLRHVFDANVSDRDLLETYTPAFEACIREGKAYSIMSAYNRFRGKSCTGSDDLLNKLAREQWGFSGYIVSDCDAVADIYNTHKITATPEEAVAIAVKAGCDLDCGDFYAHLKSAVKKGLITEKEIDVAVKRLMLARFKLGMFDPEYMVPYAKIPISANDCNENRALSLKAAQQSLVLLKNNGVLPFDKKAINKIAILGPNSNNASVMYGNYNGTPSKVVTPVEGMRKALSEKTTIYHNTLNDWVSDRGALEVVPATALESEGKCGLKAEFFSNSKLTGAPVLTRVDSVINYIWDSSSPAPGVSSNQISIRWTGTISAPETGEYSLGFSGDDGYRVWLDGKLIIELWMDQAPVLTSKNIQLVKGEKHSIKIDFYQGGGGAEARLLWGIKDPNAIDKAITEAAKCDVILYFGGLSPTLEGEEMNVPYEGFSGGDRTRIELPKIQLEILKKLKKTGKPVIFVVMAGSALALNWENENLDAILYAWYPGQEGGTAIANALMGNYSPSGRLPVTFYKSTNQLPPFENYDMKGRTYRYFEGEPLFPFGYGLSYTAFTYSNLVAPSVIKAGENATIKVTVLNSGKHESDEVVQLYVRHKATGIELPIHSLKAFRRIHLKAGESTTLVFNLDAQGMAVLDADNQWKVLPGEFEVFVGGMQPSAQLIKEGKVLVAPISKTGEAYLVK